MKYIIFLIIFLIILYNYYIFINENYEDNEDKNTFYIKWINDNQHLVKIYGKEYLYMLTYPKFSYISKLPDDIEIYPDYKLSHPIKITLNKGDSLFIPAGWWHYITSYDRNIAVNTWYIPYNKNVSNIEWRKNIKYDHIINIDNHKLNSNTFLEYVKKSQPILIKKSHDDWNAMKTWDSNDYLINCLKNTKVYFFKFPKSNFWNNSWRKSNPNNINSGTFEKFINLSLYDSNHFYYLARNYDIAVRLKDDFSNFKFTNDMELALSNIWMNYGSINCPLHYDMFDNILSQIDGYKEIYLYPPSDDKYLYVDNTKINL
jgi:hypothetical protein